METMTQYGKKPTVSLKKIVRPLKKGFFNEEEISIFTALDFSFHEIIN